MLVMVYGSLRSDGGNHGIMEKAQGDFMFPCETVEEYFKGENNFFEYVLKSSKTLNGLEEDTVLGELYIVSDDKMKILDDFEGHPTLFKREPISVEFESTLLNDVEMYFLIDEDSV